ncbi:hypothetical protein GCM10025868_14770 [Angustibacter aerolatus]|uniref:Uncharacterized protein n=1 Tax=Angustibacter aerolatus TaxID=1162965 RepID=A0ABQ6JEL8_9ACTN|nr:hypothetical protein [Angustibacter aerolatus]GMA86227.1 hypothetical protein GCM10025868_14770 [Angustibacter aerolatus]
MTALVGTPDGSKVIMGGAYKNLGTTPAYGLAALDPTTAAVLPWAVTSRVRDAGDAASILDLSTDGTYVYGSGYTFGGGGNLEGTFSATQDGTLRWIEDCHGDTYSVFGNSGAVYVANHAHYCGNIYAFPETSPRTHHRALAFSRDANPTRTITKEPGSYANWQGTAMPDLLTWFPDLVAGAVTGQDQAAWTVRGTDEYVVMGGEFPKVGSTKQQGLVRFAVPTKAPNEVGPEVAGSDLTPQVASNDPGTVRVAWTSDWDTDNEQAHLQRRPRRRRGGHAHRPLHLLEPAADGLDRQRAHPGLDPRLQGHGHRPVGQQGHQRHHHRHGEQHRDGRGVLARRARRRGQRPVAARRGERRRRQRRRGQQAAGDRQRRHPRHGGRGERPRHRDDVQRGRHQRGQHPGADGGAAEPSPSRPGSAPTRSPAARSSATAARPPASAAARPTTGTSTCRTTAG